MDSQTQLQAIDKEIIRTKNKIRYLETQLFGKPLEGGH